MALSPVTIRFALPVLAHSRMRLSASSCRTSILPRGRTTRARSDRNTATRATGFSCQFSENFGTTSKRPAVCLFSYLTDFVTEFKNLPSNPSSRDSSGASHSQRFFGNRLICAISTIVSSRTRRLSMSKVRDDSCSIVALRRLTSSVRVITSIRMSFQVAISLLAQ